jgi:hypothetical protein
MTIRIILIKKESSSSNPFVYLKTGTGNKDENDNFLLTNNCYSEIEISLQIDSLISELKELREEAVKFFNDKQ